MPHKTENTPLHPDRKQDNVTIHETQRGLVAIDKHGKKVSEIIHEPYHYLANLV